MERLIASVMGNSAAIAAHYAKAPVAPVIEQPGAMLDNGTADVPLVGELVEPGALGTVVEENMLDSATVAKNDLAAMLDAASTDNTDSVVTDEMRQDAVNVVQEWADTELDAGEGYGDRLYALCVGTASEGDGTEMSDDEAYYAATVADLVGDYLETKGIDSDDVDALLGSLDFDNDVAARVHDKLLDSMPQGDDALADDADQFVNGDDGQMMDATYRKVLAIRHGKKVRINKRMGGSVHLTAGQKAAVRKMQRKAFSGAAKMKRAKSMRVRMKTLGK